MKGGKGRSGTNSLHKQLTVTFPYRGLSFSQTMEQRSHSGKSTLQPLFPRGAWTSRSIFHLQCNLCTSKWSSDTDTKEAKKRKANLKKNWEWNWEIYSRLLAKLAGACILAVKIDSPQQLKVKVCIKKKNHSWQNIYSIWWTISTRKSPLNNLPFFECICSCWKLLLQSISTWSTTALCAIFTAVGSRLSVKCHQIGCAVRNPSTLHPWITASSEPRNDSLHRVDNRLKDGGNYAAYRSHHFPPHQLEQRSKAGNPHRQKWLCCCS